MGGGGGRDVKKENAKNYSGECRATIDTWPMARLTLVGQSKVETLTRHRRPKNLKTVRWSVRVAYKSSGELSSGCKVKEDKVRRQQRSLRFEDHVHTNVHTPVKKKKRKQHEVERHLV